MQEGCARPGETTGFLAIIVRLVGVQYGLALLEGGPADGGRVRVRATHPPLLQRETRGRRASRHGAGAQRARSARGEGPRRRRVLQDGEDGGHGGAVPDDRPNAVTARETQATGGEKLQPLAGRPPRHTRLEDHSHPGVHGQIRVLVPLAQRLAFKAWREHQCQVASGRLVEEPRRHARADGVEFPCGQGALQPEEEPTVGRGGILQAIDIGKQAVLRATQVSQGGPVRAVPRHTRHIIGEDEPALPSRDLPPSRVEALAVLGPRRAVADIGIHHVHGLCGPSQRACPLGEGVLAPETDGSALGGASIGAWRGPLGGPDVGA